MSPLTKKVYRVMDVLLLLLLLSHLSRVRLCATPYTAAHQAPSSLGFSRQEHWSGLPFPSSIHESEKSKWSRSVVSDSVRPHGLQPTRLLFPWGLLTNLIVVITLQYIQISNHLVIHIKLSKCYLSITSQQT